MVDGGSADGSAELVRDRFPKVDLLALPENPGFAGAVNRGIEQALRGGADYIALLNNDAVAEPVHDGVERRGAVGAAEDAPAQVGVAQAEHPPVFVE